MLRPKPIHGQPIPALVDLLRDADDNVRERARRSSWGRDGRRGAVLEAVTRWMTAVPANDPEREHHLLEALWVHQWHNVVNVDLLQRLLTSPEPRARAAAAARGVVLLAGPGPGRLVAVRAVGRGRASPGAPGSGAGSEFLSHGGGGGRGAGGGSTAVGLRPDLHAEGDLAAARAVEAVGCEVVVGSNPAGQAFLLKSYKTADLQQLPRTAFVSRNWCNAPGLRIPAGRWP